MIAWIRSMSMVMLGGMLLGSCTCHRTLPEAPTQPERRSGGFGAALPTKAQVAKPAVAPRLTPVVPTSSPVGETPTPGAVSLPADFPQDVPVFKDAEAFAVQQLAGDAHNVLFHVDADAPEIFNYYRDNMRTEGWNVTQEYQHNNQSFLSFRKGDTITNMTVSKDPRTGKQIIAIMYYEEKPLPFPEF